jgi:hypothetical protein
MYSYVCAHIYTYMYINICVHKYICIYTHTFIYIHAYMYVLPLSKAELLELPIIRTLCVFEYVHVNLIFSYQRSLLKAVEICWELYTLLLQNLSKHRYFQLSANWLTLFSLTQKTRTTDNRHIGGSAETDTKCINIIIS